MSSTSTKSEPLHAETPPTSSRVALPMRGGLLRALWAASPELELSPYLLAEPKTEEDRLDGDAECPQHWPRSFVWNPLASIDSS